MTTTSITDDLQAYLSIPSIAGDHQNSLKACHWLQNYMSDVCDDIVIHETANPAISFRFTASTNQDTLFFYGHYDVQPASLEEGWQADPFTATLVNDRVVARGASDNKGQHLALLSAIKAVVRDGTLKYNVVVLIEGEEEIGSPLLAGIMTSAKQRFQADEYLMIDGSSPAGYAAAIYTQTLGVLFSDVTFISPMGELHSGKYAHSPNPLIAQAKAIYELAHHPLSILPALGDNKGWSFNPTFSRSGSSSSKSVIPAEAMMSISLRLVPGQDAERIEKELRLFLENLSKEMKLEVVFTPKIVVQPTEGVSSNIANEILRINTELELATQTGRLEATLPACSIIRSIFRKDPIVVTYASHQDNSHGVDESIQLSSLQNSVEVFKKVLSVC